MNLTSSLAKSEILPTEAAFVECDNCGRVYPKGTSTPNACPACSGSFTQKFCNDAHLIKDAKKLGDILRSMADGAFTAAHTLERVGIGEARISAPPGLEYVSPKAWHSKVHDGDMVVLEDTMATGGNKYIAAIKSGFSTFSTFGPAKPTAAEAIHELMMAVGYFHPPSGTPWTKEEILAYEMGQSDHYRAPENVVKTSSAASDDEGGWDIHALGHSVGQKLPVIDSADKTLDRWQHELAYLDTVDPEGFVQFGDKQHGYRKVPVSVAKNFVNKKIITYPTQDARNPGVWGVGKPKLLSPEVLEVTLPGFNIPIIRRNYAQMAIDLINYYTTVKTAIIHEYGKEDPSFLKRDDAIIYLSKEAAPSPPTQVSPAPPAPHSEPPAPSEERGAEVIYSIHDPDHPPGSVDYTRNSLRAATDAIKELNTKKPEPKSVVIEVGRDGIYVFYTKQEALAKLKEVRDDLISKLADLARPPAPEGSSGTPEQPAPTDASVYTGSIYNGDTVDSEEDLKFRFASINRILEELANPQTEASSVSIQTNNGSMTASLNDAVQWLNYKLDDAKDKLKAINDAKNPEVTDSDASASDSTYIIPSKKVADYKKAYDVISKDFKKRSNRVYTHVALPGEEEPLPISRLVIDHILKIKARITDTKPEPAAVPKAREGKPSEPAAVPEPDAGKTPAPARQRKPSPEDTIESDNAGGEISLDSKASIADQLNQLKRLKSIS